MKISKIVKLIIAFIIIFINIIWIFNSFIMILKNDYYLNVNSVNIDELTHLLPDYTFTKKLKVLHYSHGLGDWNLYFYYAMGKTDKMTFDDRENIELRDYIVNNGYSGHILGIIYVFVAFTLIIICIIYIINSFCKKQIK